VKALCTFVTIVCSVLVLLCVGMYIVEILRFGQAAWNGELRQYWLIAGWSGDLATQLGRVFGGLILPGIGIWVFGNIAHYCGVKAEM